MGRLERAYLIARMVKRHVPRAPDGGALTLDDLPRPGLKRWVPHRKAKVVAAVRTGLVPLRAALARYNLTHDELLSWMAAVDEGGTARLRVTRLQDHRSAA
jgi:hypothetical protein